MTDRKYRVYSNNQRQPRDRYDGGLFAMILIGAGLVALASCHSLKEGKSDLIKYRMQQDNIRTNYNGGLR